MLIIIDMTGENDLSQEKLDEEKTNDENIHKKDYLEDFFIKSPQLQIIEA